jgi:ribosomal protein L19E
MNGVDIETTCSRIRKYRKYIQRLKSYHQITEKDYRSGYETYGYETIEDIQLNLQYISDRFHAAFRLSWLVNVPEEVDKLIKNYD